MSTKRTLKIITVAAIASFTFALVGGAIVLYTWSSRSTPSAGCTRLVETKPIQPATQRVVKTVEFGGRTTLNPQDLGGKRTGITPQVLGKKTTADKWNSDAVERKPREISAENLSLPKAKVADRTSFALSENSQSVLTTPPAPDLERLRLGQEIPLVNTDSDRIRVVNQHEASSSIQFSQISSNHLVIDLPDRRFLLKISGVNNRLMRIDLRRKVKSEENGGRTNALYTYDENLDSPLVANPTASPLAPEKAWNGADLPSTEKQSWKYISNVWNSSASTISLVQKFDNDSIFLSMRVPRTVQFNQSYFDSLKLSRHIVIHKIGDSNSGRALLAAQVVSDQGENSKGKPCIVVYAGEHPDEPDSMWVAQGIIDFLIGDSDAAKYLRAQCNFLIIPNLDPDGTIDGLHDSILCSFRSKFDSTESLAYSRFFENWISQGFRLDIVLNLHNGGFAKSGDVACAMLEGNGVRGDLSFELHKSIVNDLGRNGFTTQSRPWARGWTPFRLCGWLSRYYGPFSLAYEVDSQQATRHLNVDQMFSISRHLIESVSKTLLDSSTGESIRYEVDIIRSQREQNLKKYRQSEASESRLTYEYNLSQISDADRKRSKGEKFYP